MIRYAIPKPEPLRVEVENFRDAVIGKPSASVVSMRQGVRIVAVAEALLASARDGRTVDPTDHLGRAPAPAMRGVPT
jgi:UDP-N-acetylglucosamine 3-dehydrogenase